MSSNFMKMIDERYLHWYEIKQKAPTQGLPSIPENLEDDLECAYVRYLELIDVTCGLTDREEIEADRIKYSNLICPKTESGSAIFDEKHCVEYMHVCSGISKVICAAYIYQEDIDLVGSGLIEGDDLETIMIFYKETKKLIAELEEK